MDGFYIGDAMERDEFGLRIKGCVIPGTHGAFPQSARAGAASLSGGEKETTTVINNRMSHPLQGTLC